MPRDSRLRAVGIWLLLSLVAGAQSPPAFDVASAATGLRPVGIDGFTVTVTRQSPPFVSTTFSYAVVANSGENSVSVFGVGTPPSLVQTLTGIPGPYGVAACGRLLLVTSPGDNSVSVLRFPDPPTGSTFAAGSVVGKIGTGRQPYAVACGDVGVVANFGDSTLTVLNTSSLTVQATVPDVPGSRALTSVVILPGTASSLDTETAWVSGTDANIVTVVDLGRASVLRKIPLPQPTTISRCSLEGGRTGMCIATAGTVTAIDPATFASVPAVQYMTVPNLQEFSAGIALSNSAVSLWTFGPTVSPRAADPVLNIPGVAGLASAANSSGNIVSQSGTRYTLATSTSANSLVAIRWIPSTESPQPPFRVANAASFSPLAVAAGSLASLFFGTGASQEAKASTVPLPTSLAGVSLKIGGTLSFIPPAGLTYSLSGSVPTGLLFAGANQINFQLPTGIAPAPYVQTQLTMPDGTTKLGMVTIAATSPGIFAVTQDGIGQGAILNRDFTQNGSPQIVPGARPASRGEVVHIYATGCGETTPTLLPGEPASISGNPLVITKLQPTVTIGGQSARVLFSGLAPGFVGLWQIDAEVPQTVIPGTVLPVIVSIGGQTSNTVTIAVQ